MTTWIHVLYAVAWFALGAVAGAQWTRMRREVRQLANAQTGEDVVASHKDIDKAPQRARPRRWPRRVLDTFVVLLFVSSAVNAYVTSDQIQAVVECQRGYQKGFADALDARSKATQEAQEALDELMSIVGTLAGGAATPENRSRFANALTAYLQKRAEAKRQQQEHPYPPSPHDVCK